MFVVKINKGEEYTEVCENLELIKFFQTEDEAIDFVSELNEEMDEKLSKLVDGDYSHINSPGAYYEPITSEVLVSCKYNGFEIADSFADVKIDFPEVELMNTADFKEALEHENFRIVCGQIINADIANEIIAEYGTPSFY
jgi:hypothetical protein